MKKWTQRELRAGGVVDPSAVNDELRAQQSSMTTLDREQLSADWINETHLADYAIIRGYFDARYPSTNYGEQTIQSDAAVTPSNGFLSIIPRLDPGSWFDINETSGAITLSGFKGGNLFAEWSGNALVFPPFAATQKIEFPQNPKYLGLRILVNNSLLVERRGPAYHEHFRIFGAGNFPAGDLELRLQAKVTSVGPDDPLVILPGGTQQVPQAHLYSNKYCVLGRFR